MNAEQAAAANANARRINALSDAELLGMLQAGQCGCMVVAGLAHPPIW